MSAVPSVGRIVHYRSYGSKTGPYEPECRAAIITEVGGWITYRGDDPTDEYIDADVRYRELHQRFEPDACVLKVESPTGTFNNLCRYDVPPTAEDGTTTPTPGTWHWPERTPE